METTREEAINLLPKDGEVLFYPHFFNSMESDKYFEILQQQVTWQQEPVIIFGRQVMQPRLTALYGDAGKTYQYSGITMKPEPWLPVLEEIRQRVMPIQGHQFSSALLNLYRNGWDYMGWHRDNEKELGVNPVIASVSFGVARSFLLRHYKEKTLKVPVTLTHGSLLLMRGSTQHHWEHSLPRRMKVTEPRINITFRNIIS